MCHYSPDEYDIVGLAAGERAVAREDDHADGQAIIGNLNTNPEASNDRVRTDSGGHGWHARLRRLPPAGLPAHCRTSSVSAGQNYRTGSPVTARPMIMRWISLVPSKIVKIFASRCQRFTGYSRV